MTILEISQRIASLTDAHRECMLLISRLSKLGGPGTDTARLELANVIHQSLKDADQELELLSTQVDDEIGDGNSTNGAALASKINKLTEDMKIARLQYRKAQLTSKRLSEATAQRERERLLGGSGRSTPDSITKRGGKGKGNQNLTQSDLLINASTDVTTALRRTHTLLQSELSRSVFATETLNASTAALTDLSSRYSAFDDIVASSRQLITDLIRKNKSDRWYYDHAIYLLVSMLIWILIRRLVWGPVWLVVGVPFRLVWWALTCFAWVIGAGGDGGVSELQKGADADGSGFVGATATVEVKGIPKSLLEQTPSSTGSIAPVATEESMREKVEKIIDPAEPDDSPSGSSEGEDYVYVPSESYSSGSSEDEIEDCPPGSNEGGELYSPTEEGEERNTKSRKMDYDSEQTPIAQAAEEEQGRNPRSRRMEYDPVEERRVQEEAGVEMRETVEAVGTAHDEL